MEGRGGHHDGSGRPVTTWSELADAVRRCAGRPAGAVQVAGRPGGLIRLRAGAVVGTWTSGTPLAVPSPDPGTRSAAATAGPLARLAMTDAVFVMAAGRITSWRAEDDPAADPTADPAAEAGGVRMEADALLAEVDRRMRRVSGPDGVLAPEETVVRVVERSAAWRSLAPTPQERRLLGVLAVRPDVPRIGPEVRTVRDLAFALGRGVFAVLLDVQRLAAMGAVTLEARRPAPEAEPTLLVQARSALDGPAVAAVSAALRRHRVEMTGERPSVSPAAAGPAGRSGQPPAPDDPPPAQPRTAQPHIAQPRTAEPRTAPAAAGPQPAPQSVPQSAPAAAAPGPAPRALARRIPGAADRARRKVPWSPRRQPDQGDGQR
jgi:hypothetical protein